MQIELTLISYLIDRVFGEFKFITHPIIYIGKYISFFEKNFYKDTILRGAILTISLILIIFLITSLITHFVSNIYLLALLSSMGIASNMLYNSVRDVINSKNPKEKIAMLVSRDTQNMSESDIYKASIETYAENLSDAVVAPLFYLLLFGLEGLFIYKGINTLDSMVGYKTEKYKNFGKFSAKLDDIVNYIPSRATALLIIILSFSRNAFKNLKFAKGHESPNAGYPISAMAGVLNISLGGATSYFGKIREKPYFGDGRREIRKEDVLNGLKFQIKLDLFIIISLFLTTL